ncbi:uncharacterized protein JCM6883_004892 [Sporobolomyces salmoneus]|uniref:uncharacterized protein n=1 Tax=Sporobolomyces salmoneus TaxID=183962 RepID=UPI00317CB6FD
MSRSPIRTRRAKPTPSNSLILVLPSLLFSPSLLPLFELHFASYGRVVAWTPLEKLGRVLVVYDEVRDSKMAKEEMDGFVWEDEASTTSSNPDLTGQPLRAFFGPSIPLPIPTSLSSALLAVPSTGKNFLISPPGSPPVGWEQIEEDAPNKQIWHEEDETEPVDLGPTFNEKWADELVKALRFLSVDSGDGDGNDDQEEEVRSGQGEFSKTHVILPPSSDSPRPAVVVSTPPISSTPSPTGTPPPEASRITSVKATIESMLVKKRSFSDLRNQAFSPARSIPSTPGGLGTPSLGGGSGGATRITPTARPPLAS